VKHVNMPVKSKAETDVAEISPISRSFRRRVKRITVEELRLLFDWSLSGTRIFHLQPGERFYIAAKVGVDAPEPLYPYRQGESRRVAKGDYRQWQEFPCRDQDKWTYPRGRFTTWLRTAEIEQALSRGHLIACYEALIFLRGHEDRRRWAQLRREVFKRHGHRCMRCGSVDSELQVDHVKPWRSFPDLRYDVNNLQVLCRTCHERKGEEDNSACESGRTDKQRASALCSRRHAAQRER
jgi:HNH endonuclease